MEEQQIEPEVIEEELPIEQPEEELETVEEVEAEEEGEIVVTIEGEEKEEEKAPSWVKELRRKNREDQKRIRELEQQLNAVNGQSVKLPTKPKLADFDYDEDEFDKAMDSYYAEKAKYDAEERKKAEAVEEVEKAFKERQTAYIEAKSAFPAEQIQECESIVTSVLSPPRQAMLLDVADDAAKLVFALGQNESVLQELSKIKSDGQFIKKLVQIEGKTQVTTKQKAPPPERRVSGGGRAPGSSQSRLDELRAEAERSGDFTKYYEYKRSIK